MTELLPTLKSDPRPSKHAIVDASIAYHHTQQARCDRVNQALQFMIAERDELLREVNHLRDICHHGSCVPRQARPIDPAVLAMLTGSDIQTTDLTSEQVVCDGVSGATPQIINRSLAVSQPDESLLAVEEGSLVDSSTVVQQPELSQPSDSHTLVGLSKESNQVNFPQWDWAELNLNTVSQEMVFSPTAINGTTLPWDTTHHIPAATPPQDVESKYSTDSLCVADDSARFWTQPSGGMNTTPPSDNVLSADLDLSTMWHPSLFLQGTEETGTIQINNSANLFNLDPESLSRPVEDMVASDPVDLSARLRSAVQ